MHIYIYIYMYCIRTYLHLSLSLYIYICEIINDTNGQKMIKEISLLCCGLPSNLTTCNWVFPMKGTCIWLTKLVQSTGIKRDSHGRKFDWLERAVCSEIWRAEHFQHFKASRVSQALVAYHPRQKQLSYGPSTGIAVAEILLVSKTSGRFIPKT